MKAKLIKTEKGYYIDTGSFDGIHLACYSHDVTKQRLSLKNCQAIERGYDLDELAEQSRNKVSMLFKDGLHPKSHTVGFRAGWQQAVNMMGDKKFSSGQLLNAMDLVWQWMNGEDYGCKTLTEVQDKHIQSLKQTEWEVTVEMEYVGECNGNNDEGCFQDSPGHDCGCYEYKPKLDADGCLILKRV